MTDKRFETTEAALLGGLVHDNHKIDDVVQMRLAPEDFTTDAHRRIFRAILKLHEASAPVSTISLADELRNEIQDVTYGYLAELPSFDPTGASVSYNARKVLDRSRIRRLHQVACEIARSTATGDGPVDSLQEEAERRILELSSIGFAGGAVPIDDELDELLAEICQEDEPGVVGLTSTLPAVDRLIGGLRPSELIVIGARPCNGKTAMLMQIASAAALAGNTVHFVSLEMSKKELQKRYLSHFARVDSRRINSRELTASDRMALMDKGRSSLVGQPLFVADEQSQRVLRIAATARRLKRQHSLGLIVVDYIQLVETENQRAPRHEQVGLVSRRLKGLAKELGVPVLCAAQLNRQVSDRSGGEPRLSDIRECGGIEADADVVALLHRPDEKKPEEMTLDIAKNRHGPTGKISLAFDGRYSKFKDLTPLPRSYFPQN